MNSTKRVSLFSMAVENLWRHRRRSIVVLLPLIAVIGLASAMTFVKNGLEQHALGSLAVLPDITVQKLTAGRVERMSVDCIPRISQIRGVKKVVPRVWGYLPLRVKNRDVAYTMMGVDLANMPVSADIELALDEGRFLRSGEKGKAVVGGAFTAAFHAHVGDSIELTDSFGTRTFFEVVGVFSGPLQIYTADTILVSQEDAREFFGYSANRSSDLCVYLDSPLVADRVAQDILFIYPDFRVLTKDVLIDLTRQAYGGRSGVFQLMWLILLAAVMLVGWAQTTGITIEMGREIGILKAIGWSTMDVIEVKLYETLTVGVLGFLGGVLLGWLYLLGGAPGIKEYFLGWSTIYPDFPIPVYVQASDVVVLLVVAVFPLLAATVVPTWILAIVEPDRAIRGNR